MDRRILVVDDSEAICQQLRTLLGRPDRPIVVAHDGTTALEMLTEGDFSLVLIDLRLPGINGMELIREIRDRDMPVTPILMTGYASIPVVVDAMQLGAYDFVEKPVDVPRLEILIEKAFEDRRIHDEVRELRRGQHDRYAHHNLLGKSARMRDVFQKVTRVASSACPVLVMGETGTGKELVSLALHYNDTTRTGPMVAVNCAALPEPLLESEFFGHERGAFTGADRQRKGRFELAKGGTLLLDEIGSVPIRMQAKLLRVLQDGTFERVGGGGEVIQADCRIVAATNEDLGAAVEAGTFRRDLYYRLNVVAIELPPLRERMDDLPLLVDHFLKALADRGYPERTVDRDALARLGRYDWPGNVRELEHVIEQMVVTTTTPVISAEHIPAHLTTSGEEPFHLDFDPSRPLQEITDELTERIERAYLKQVLEHHRGRIEPTAAHCQLSRRSISEKLRRYGIDKADFKSSTRSRRPAVAETA